METTTDNSMESPAGVAIRELSLRYGLRDSVLEDLNLIINPSEILVLLGPSGCGKSSLLRLIAGLAEPTSGQIFIESESPKRRSSDLSFVFQDANLLPWRTAFDNVLLPLELHKQSSGQVQRISNPASKVREALTQVQLPESSWNKYPAQLSGGMRMRVSIARALVTDPCLLLMDEPFAALDDLLRNRLNILLLELHKTSPKTVVFVTHNIAEACFLSHRVAVFGKQKIVETITNPLPWPRDSATKTSVAFAELCARVSECLSTSNQHSVNKV